MEFRIRNPQSKSTFCVNLHTNTVVLVSHFADIVRYIASSVKYITLNTVSASLRYREDAPRSKHQSTVGFIKNGTLVFLNFSAQDASISKISVPIIKRRS